MDPVDKKKTVKYFLTRPLLAVMKRLKENDPVLYHFEDTTLSILQVLQHCLLVHVSVCETQLMSFFPVRQN